MGGWKGKAAVGEGCRGEKNVMVMSEAGNWFLFPESVVGRITSDRENPQVESTEEHTVSSVDDTGNRGMVRTLLGAQRNKNRRV